MTDAEHLDRTRTGYDTISAEYAECMAFTSPEYMEFIRHAMPATGPDGR